MRRRPMTPELTYDPEADAVYIRLSDVAPYEGDDAGPTTLHFSRDDQVVGIEILNASKVMAPGAWSGGRVPAGRRLHAAG